MVRKSPVQPLCRFCGKAIAKWTETVFFGSDHATWPGQSCRADKPKSKEEAQRLINSEVVSVRWRTYDVWDGEREKYIRTRDYIDRVTTWDGESYIDLFFCNGTHAQRFGYAAARAGSAMPAYNEAIRTQNNEPKALAA